MLGRRVSFLLGFGPFSGANLLLGRSQPVGLSAHTVVEGLGPSNLSAASRLWQVGHVRFFRGHSFSWMSARGGGASDVSFFFLGGNISMEKCLCILLCIFLHILLIFVVYVAQELRTNCKQYSKKTYKQITISWNMKANQDNTSFNGLSD